MFTSCLRRRDHRRRGCRHHIRRRHDCRRNRLRHIRHDCRRNLPCWMSRACCWNERCPRCSLPTRRQIRHDYPSKRCSQHCDCLHDQHRRPSCRCLLDCRHRRRCDCPHRPHRDCRHYQRLRGASCCRDFRLAGPRFAARLAGDCLMNHHASCRRICLRYRDHHREHHLDGPDCVAT